MDAGYGDVGVDQEPDAGTLDDRDDPDFAPTEAALAAADDTNARETQAELSTADGSAADEIADLKNTKATEDE
ncbi:hypothetical protein HaLaN_12274, partial [Haematococcus lacustris]